MKWLKNALFEEQPEFEKKKDTPPPIPGAPALPTTPTILMAPATYQAPTISVAAVGANPQIREQLLTAVKAVVDPKYAHFKAMSDSMKAVIPDAKQRFSAAFVAVKGTTGATKETIVQGATVMLEALRKEKAIFANEMSGAIQQIDSIAAKKQADASETIQAKKAQIEQLTNEINAISTQHANDIAQLEAQKAQVTRTQQEFEVTESELEKELTTEISDLTTYIQG